VTRPLIRTTIRTAALLLSLLTVAGCDRGDHPRALGRPAPDFTVSDGTQSVHLADYRGKIVLLNFWATWCAPCIEELPSLQALHQELPQVVVIAVSVDEDPDAYRHFLKVHPLNLLTVEDTGRHVNALYGTSLFPESYVIDRNGIIRRKFVNAQDWTNPEIVNYLSHL
jgi:cytochrome c biogenesis protein CcmG/thiol:disulfide interchange protein DsbE